MRRFGVRVGMLSAVAVASLTAFSFAVALPMFERRDTPFSSGAPTASDGRVAGALIAFALADFARGGGWSYPSAPGGGLVWAVPGQQPDAHTMEGGVTEAGLPEQQGAALVYPVAPTIGLPGTTRGWLDGVGIPAWAARGTSLRTVAGEPAPAGGPANGLDVLAVTEPDPAEAAPVAEPILEPRGEEKPEEPRRLTEIASPVTLHAEEPRERGRELELVGGPEVAAPPSHAADEAREALRKAEELAVQQQPVATLAPEPATLGLLASGLISLGIAGMLRRRGRL